VIATAMMLDYHNLLVMSVHVLLVMSVRVTVVLVALLNNDLGICTNDLLDGIA
jgi:hypothetical protein